MKPLRDYRNDEAAVRGAWHATAGAPPAVEPAEIARRSGCTRAVALRVAHLRICGTAEVLSWWLAGDMSLRQVERVVTTDPEDAEEQRAAALRCMAPIIRKRYEVAS